MSENKLNPGSNMRWESMRMILPEHREMWLKHREDMKKVEKLVLDEQQWEEFERTINEAMEYNTLLEFTYWDEGFFCSITGTCEHVNVEQKQFHIVDDKGDIRYLKFDMVVDIQSI